MSAKKFIILSIVVISAVLAGGGYLILKKTEIINNASNANQKNNNQSQIKAGGQTGRLYEVDVTNSQIVWQGEKITGSGHVGTVKLLTGQIRLDNDNNVLSADFTIDMNSLTESRSNQQVIQHLKSADFFNAVTYPYSELKITKAEKNGSDSFDISGDLTIKGITQTIVFPAQIIIADDGIQAKAEFSIDRTKWDIKYGSGKFFKGLADNAIKDEINFKIEIAASIKK